MSTWREAERSILRAIDSGVGAHYCESAGCRTLVSGKANCDRHNGLVSHQVVPDWPPPESSR